MAELVLPGAVAGMSVGAFGAAVACGTLSFADALRVVRLRGELMQAAFPTGYGLAAITGLDEVRVEDLVERIRTVECPLYISNVNAPLQIVVAGSDAALSAIKNLAIPAGAQRVDRLAVGVPSHCPLLQPVGDRLTQAMAGALAEAAQRCHISVIAAVAFSGMPMPFVRISPPTWRIRSDGTSRFRSCASLARRSSSR